MTSLKNDDKTWRFNSRDSYLESRQNWKIAYAALSQRIRDLKFARKSVATLTKLGQLERYEAVKKANQTPFGFDPQGLAALLRTKATEMIEERQESKVEAQRLYLAARAEALVAH